MTGGGTITVDSATFTNQSIVITKGSFYSGCQFVGCDIHIPNGTIGDYFTGCVFETCDLTLLRGGVTQSGVDHHEHPLVRQI